MKKITALEELRASIELLETKQTDEAILLKEQFKVTYESLKPVNLFKKMLHEFTSDDELKSNLTDTTLGLAAGYLSKKAVIGSNTNPFKQVLGSLIQMGVSSIVSKNADGIKSTIASLISRLFLKNETTK